ncbi:hypothetical protein HY949_02005 [Candidatus Gottesmanbacteria bacterium]|nr:hypothetical protein [Candidatus Gottesmanbacteria bacterium]
MAEEGKQEMGMGVVEDPLVKASQEMRDQVKRDETMKFYLERVKQLSKKEKVSPMDISRQLLRDLGDKSDPKAYLEAIKVLSSGVYRVFGPILFPRPPVASPAL